MAKRKKSESLLAKIAVILLGIVFIAMAGVLLVACLSYNENDAGYNIANSREISNVLGVFGSTVASFMLVWTGIALPVFLLAMMVWGYEIIRYKTFIKHWWRVLSLCFGVWSLSIFGSLVWGSVNGFKIGGNIGDFFSREIMSLLVRQSGFAYNKVALIIVSAFLAFVSFNFACGITFGSWYRVIKKIILTIWSFFVWLCVSGKKICKKAKNLSSEDCRKKEYKRKPRKEPKFAEDETTLEKETENKEEPKKKQVTKILQNKNEADNYVFPDVNLLSV